MLTTLLALATSLATVTVSPPAPASPPDPASAPAQAPPGAADATGPATAGTGDIDTLLDRLEHAGDDVRDFTATIAYQRTDALTGDAEYRYGRLVVESTADRSRRIAIVFDQYIDGTGRSDTLDERFVFAGSWMCEVDGARRQFIKRQIVPPGQKFDPLKIGEGPFPVPIGQSANDMRQRFAVSEAPAPTANLLASLRPDTIHALRLVPRAGTEAAADFASIDLYYDRTTLMPLGVDALLLDGGRRVARLNRSAINQGLSEKDLALLSVEPPDPAQWTIDIRAWKPAPEEAPSPP